MRVVAILSILLLSAPAAGALLAAPPLDGVDLVEPLPSDIKDADVLAMLAFEMGLTPTRLPIPTPPADLDVPAMVLRLGTRAGLAIAPADATAFAELHPLIAQPVLTMLVAIDQAWTMRDAAFADVSPEELARLRSAIDNKVVGPPILSDDDMEMLVNAAIMLSDTIESVVIPQLQAAADLGIGPPIAIADPVGVLRIGSSGNDVETIDRILQIDITGDDTYYNNAGGTTAGDARRPFSPIGVSIDISGSDVYTTPVGVRGHGGAFAGIALHYDVRGDDARTCLYRCGGSGAAGIGILRDHSGNDVDIHGIDSLGAGGHGLGYFRDDSGDDIRRGSGGHGGSGFGPSLGLFWDRSGTDRYEALGNGATWGHATNNGRGWFVDETSSIDTWVDVSNYLPHPYTCNDCTWTSPPGQGGRGNDNRGGLAYLIAKQDP